MKLIKSLLLILILSLTGGCYSGFYTGETTEDLILIGDPYEANAQPVTLPARSSVAFKKGKRYYISCRQYRGYAKKTKLTSVKKREETHEASLLPFMQVYGVTEQKVMPLDAYYLPEHRSYKVRGSGGLYRGGSGEC